jgi:hypothetical protein
MAVDTGSKDGLEGFAGALAAGLEGSLSHYIYTARCPETERLTRRWR